MSGELPKVNDTQGMLRKLVQDKLKSAHPETVGELSRLVSSNAAYDESKFISTIKNMKADGSIDLREPALEIDSIWDYVLPSPVSAWFWATLIVVSLAAAVIVLAPTGYVFVGLRWLLGLVFSLYLPGFALLRLLYPKGSELDPIERFVLSVGVSLAVVPLVGLALYYSSLGLDLLAITSFLAIFTLLAAIGAAVRGYMTLRKESTDRGSGQ
jgi:hypothetical protein